MPWPKDAVASLHFPHLSFSGTPISSISKFIWLIRSNLFIYSINFSNPNFWPIRTDPIFPDLIRISSAVKFEGIFKSYSLIVFPPQRILFSKSTNSVLVSTIFSFSAAAKVKVLKTEPSSYTPFVALLIKLISSIFCLWFKSKSGKETKDKISPLLTFINIAALPLASNILLNLINSFLIKYWISSSTVSWIGLLVSFNFLSNVFSNPEIPILSSSIWPTIWLNKFFCG